jgi:hypothetical protein
MAWAYPAGRTLREAGALFGFSALACRTALLRNGVARRTRPKAQRIGRSSDDRSSPGASGMHRLAHPTGAGPFSRATFESLQGAG